MQQPKFIHSSIGKKILMAITGFFLMIFLLVHLSINLFLFVGEDAFNKASHFMSTNPFIQVSQYILAVGFIIHIFFGIKLFIQNNGARGEVSYIINQWQTHTPFNARTMIYTGGLVLCFLILHLNNFTIPIKMHLTSEVNDYKLVTSHFKSPIYTIIYIISFIFLAIHLSHGFKSAFQSTGAYHKNYIHVIRKAGILYFWVISLGFSAIAFWFFFKNNAIFP